MEPEENMTILDDLPNRTLPYIAMTALNEPIEIVAGSFQLFLPNEGTGRIDGHLRFRWLPSTAMEFEGGYSGPPVNLLAQEDVSLRIEEMGLDVPVLITNAQGGRSPQQIRGVFRRAATVCTAANVDHVRFSLVNFPEYFGNVVRYEVDRTWGRFSGRLGISSPDFVCTVDGIPEIRELHRAANRDAGFVISHVGEIRPLHGRLDTKGIDDLLDVLHLFFGFLCGTWSGPVFPEGFTGNERTWKQFAAWKLYETGAVPTWLPQANPLELNGLFSGFLEKCSDPSWRSTLRKALGWLVQANSSLVAHETKIVMAQITLELLAWVELVENRRLHSRSDFGRLSAAGRIRSLLHHLNIPSGVPLHCQELMSLQDGEAFDGPGILVRLRNALVHATGDSRALTSSLSGLHLWTAGQLALQYVELAILALCGYQGKYARRAWRGWRGEDEAFVPWVTDALTTVDGALGS